MSSQGPTSPTVSLCVPLYRPDPRYLTRLVDSFVAQQYDDLEVVMVDDASPDLDHEALEAMLAPLRERIPITFARNAHNLGMVGNWNRAVGAGHAELTMLVSQDDELGAGMLAAYTAEFVADPGVVLVSGSEEFIDEDSRPSSHKVSVGHRHNVFVRHDRYVLDHAEMVRMSLRSGQGFGEPSSVMFRRSAFTAVGGYDPLFEHAADVDFNLRASMHGRSVYLRQAYLRRRWHEEGFTQTNFVTGALTRDRLRLYERYHDTEGLTERDRADARSALASRSVYDILRAARVRQWGVARAALGNLRRGWRAPLAVHAAHVKEIATHRNRYER